MKPYTSLTEQGQTRSLRALALHTLQYYPLSIARMRLITNDMNGIFFVDVTDGSKFLLRVTVHKG